jgi:MoaA/NifB/PqqE/SkfB family radical SAM enzyme
MIRDEKPLRTNLDFQWFVSDLCNYRCPYCEVSGARRPGTPWLVGDRPAEDWIAAWDRIADRYGAAFIRLTGGEPTRLPGFLSIVGRMALRHKVSFDTNLSWSAEELERFMELVPPERTEIDVSVHSTEADVDEILSKCARLKERSYALVSRMVAFPPLLASAPALRDRFEAAGLRFIVNPYQGDWEGRSYPRDYTPSERRLISETTGALDPARAADRDQVRIAAHILNMPGESPRGRLCRSGQKYARVMHDGAVFRCQPYEINGWEPMGSLFDPAFRMREAPALCRSDACEFEYKYLV